MPHLDPIVPEPCANPDTPKPPGQHCWRRSVAQEPSRTTSYHVVRSKSESVRAWSANLVQRPWRVISTRNMRAQTGSMLDFSDLDSADPLKRDLAYLLFLEELLGPEWVERWARERGKLDALREWRKVARAI